MIQSIFLILVMAISPLWAELAKPILSEDHVGLDYSANLLPHAMLTKELKSGLSSTVVFRFRLRDQNSKLVMTQANVVKVHFDLWDELYRTSYFVRDARSSETFKTTQELFAKLKFQLLHKLVPLKVMKPSMKYVFECDILVNPISQEHIKKIQKWISENSVTPSLEKRQTSATGTPSSTLRFNKLFTDILEKYMSSDATKAAWKQSFKSSSFRLDGIKR